MATATAAEATAAAAAAVEAQKTRNSFKNANVHQRGSPKMAEFVVVSLFCQIVLLNFLENFCIVWHYIAPLLLFFFSIYFYFFCSFDLGFLLSRCQNEMSEEVVAWRRRQWTVLFCFLRFGLALFSTLLFCTVLFYIFCCLLSSVSVFCDSRRWPPLSERTSNKSAARLCHTANKY